MSAEKRRAIASKGGDSVPAHKRSFSKDRKLASDAAKNKHDKAEKDDTDEPAR